MLNRDVVVCGFSVFIFWMIFVCVCVCVFFVGKKWSFGNDFWVDGV